MDDIFKWHGEAGGSALRSEVAGCSALLELLGGSALPELLGAAEAKNRFMAQSGELVSLKCLNQKGLQ